MAGAHDGSGGPAAKLLIAGLALAAACHAGEPALPDAGPAGAHGQWQLGARARPPAGRGLGTPEVGAVGPVGNGALASSALAGVGPNRNASAGTVQGVVQAVEVGSGRLLVHTAHGDVALRGLPQQLSRLEVGQRFRGRYQEFGIGARWLVTGSVGSSDLGRPERATGTIVAVDEVNGLVTLDERLAKPRARATFHAPGATPDVDARPGGDDLVARGGRQPLDPAGRGGRYGQSPSVNERPNGTDLPRHLRRTPAARRPERTHFVRWPGGGSWPACRQEAAMATRRKGEPPDTAQLVEQIGTGAAKVLSQELEPVTDELKRQAKVEARDLAVLAGAATAGFLAVQLTLGAAVDGLGRRIGRANVAFVLASGLTAAAWAAVRSVQRHRPRGSLRLILERLAAELASKARQPRPT